MLLQTMKFLLRGDNEPESECGGEIEQEEPNNNKVVKTQPKKQIVSNILPDLPASEFDRSAIFDIATNSIAVTSSSKADARPPLFPDGLAHQASVLIPISNIVSTTNKIRE